MEEEFVSLRIPKDLFEEISRRINGTGFKSVSEYVAFVLEEAVSEEEEVYSAEEEEEVKERLRGLGYL
jgi:Arc/MetJ-type ribon-helix-helix transcriptional regulator